MFKPLIADVLLSERVHRAQRAFARLKRRFDEAPPTVELFYRAGDPHSHLLLMVCADLVDGYGIDITLHIIRRATEPPDQHQRQLLQWALVDAQKFASAMQLPMATVPPVRLADGLEAAMTRSWRLHKDLTRCQALSDAYWQSDTDTLAPALARIKPNDLSHAEIMTRKAGERLQEIGHYDAGVLFFGDECYRGVERLRHLTTRLRAERLTDGSPAARQALSEKLDAVESHPVKLRLSPNDQDAAPEWFFSFRSPYSWLALQRTLDVCQQAKRKPMLRPVMPMIERGVPLSPEKRRYLIQDAAREARRYGVPFGRIADPLGRGVTNASAGFMYAKTQGVEIPFTRAAMRAIWSQGIDLAKPAGLKRVLASVGLSYAAAARFIGAPEVDAELERNAKALADLALWGVPVLSVDGLALWGQDRLWQCTLA
ncbi:MAG: DsbA family protein [Woeseiaceae bacterium]